MHQQADCTKNVYRPEEFIKKLALPSLNFLFYLVIFDSETDIVYHRISTQNVANATPTNFPESLNHLLLLYLKKSQKF
jgi:hypothetical protein